MSRITFKTVLKDLKETNTPFILSGGGDGKIGFALYDGPDSSPVEGSIFTTKNVASIPNRIVDTVRLLRPESPFAQKYPTVQEAQPKPVAKSKGKKAEATA